MGAVSIQVKPDLYGYHDYREYLKDLLAHLRETANLSVRRLCLQTGVSESYMSMVLSGARDLSSAQLEKIAPVLGLDRSDISYMEWLIELAVSRTYDEKMEALKKIQRFRGYKQLNPLEIKTYRYLEHWYHVAIRELAALPEFRHDPEWIQAQLRWPVSIKEIKHALEFLTENDFIQQSASGQSSHVDGNVHCKTGVLKPALTKFHSEMLHLAAQSILDVPSDERNVSAHTCSIPEAAVPEVKRILDEAREKIRRLAEAQTEKREVVYHFGFLAFPLSKKNGS